MADTRRDELLRSILRFDGGSILVTGILRVGEALMLTPRATNKFGPCEDESERGILPPAKQMEIMLVPPVGRWRAARQESHLSEGLAVSNRDNHMGTAARPPTVSLRQ